MRHPRLGDFALGDGDEMLIIVAAVIDENIVEAESVREREGKVREFPAGSRFEIWPKPRPKRWLFSG